MSYKNVLLLICLTASLIFGFFFIEVSTSFANARLTEKEIVKNLVMRMPDGRISRSVINKKVYFTQEMSANDAVISIYDRNGIEIGSCDYWNKRVHPLCSKLNKNSKVVFVPADNVWNLRAVNKYKIDLTKLNKNIPSEITDPRDQKVVQNLINKIPISRVLRFNLNEVIYFTQEMSANDAVINIYDRNGIEIGSCDYWNKRVHPLCPILKNSELIYVSADNVWNIQPVNKFSVFQNNK